jgi:hypothetical protein
MEELEEQCTVVFALIVKEPALVIVCWCVWKGREDATPLHPYLAGSITIYAKRTVHCSPGSSV